MVAENHRHPVFIDQGSNLEAIICPACRARLSFHTAPNAQAVQQWWYSIAEQLEGANLANLQVAMMCCQSSVSFGDLGFDWPAGVASFEISVMNPGIAQALPEGLVRQLEGILGCRVRQVWAHY